MGSAWDHACACRVWEGACTAASVPWNQAEGPLHQNLRAAVHSHPQFSYLTSAQSAQKQPDGRAYGVRGALQLTPEAALMARERSHPELSPGPQGP